MAQALFQVGDALTTIDTDKLDALGDFAIENSFANVGNAIAGAIGSIFGGGETEDSTSKELSEIKSVLQQILNKETNIYLDSTKVGTGFAVASSKIQ